MSTLQAELGRLASALTRIESPSMTKTEFEIELAKRDAVIVSLQDTIVKLTAHRQHEPLMPQVTEVSHPNIGNPGGRQRHL
jgi:hypothetical protein